MNKRITIYDLAKMLNVSPGTVSRSLNDHPSISKKTKERVIAKANELGYKSNKFAANLSKQQTNTIGIIVPKLDSYFMSSMLAGIEKTVNEAGYNLIISQSLESMEKEKLNAATLFSSSVDAILVSLAYDTSSFEHFTPFIQHNIPLLFLDRVHHIPNCATLIIDNRLAGEEATEHLIQQGCKNLLYIGGNPQRNVYSDRFKGFKDAHLKNNFTVDASYYLESDLSRDSIGMIVAHLKSTNRKIDGLFVASDTFAAHLIKALVQGGYKVPEDLKIIGFNNDPVSELVTPTLSTIDYPGYEMGVLAGQSVISQLKGSINFKSANTITLRHQLIIRESTLNNK